ALFVEPREKALHTRAKIPDQAWLFELDGRKLHVRLQICVGFLEKLIRGKKLRDERGNDERDCNPQGRRGDSDVSKQGASISNRCGFVPAPVPRKQEREQRKSRQGVMRQLRANQRKDSKNRSEEHTSE